MSSIVALELFAGCRTPRQEKALASFLKPFEQAGRPVTPDHACFREAGRVLAGLQRDGIGTAHRRQIVNDVLIAVTAGRTGVVVVTANAAGFALIEKHTPVRWMLPGWFNSWGRRSFHVVCLIPVREGRPQTTMACLTLKERRQTL